MTTTGLTLAQIHGEVLEAAEHGGQDITGEWTARCERWADALARLRDAETTPIVMVSGASLPTPTLAQICEDEPAAPRVERETRKVICLYYTEFYFPTTEADKLAAWEAMKAHDQSCAANPLVQRLAALESPSAPIDRASPASLDFICRESPATYATVRSLFLLTDAVAIELHAGDREPSTYLRRESYVPPAPPRSTPRPDGEADKGKR